MNRVKTCAMLAPALMILGCEQAQPPADTGNLANATTPAELPEPAPANAADDGSSDLTPPVLTPEAERSEAGARNVLISFARAIELKEFGQAWGMLSPADQRKWSKAEFARVFADLGKISVAMPTGTMEGAAGSSFYTAPITISANETSGRLVRIEGEAVLRRVNDVPGATAAQLRWHFEKLTLEWTH